MWASTGKEIKTLTAKNYSLFLLAADGRRRADAGYRPRRVRRERARGGDAHKSPPRKNDHHHAATEMCWRQVSKLQKTVLIVLLYLTIYLLISYAMTPETTMTFVSEELRVGAKYALIFIVAPAAPVFSDADGADVFKNKNCGKCFVTNNRGFLPMSEYDAILVYGERNLLTETAAFMDPGKRYLLETTKKCLGSKFKKCIREPRITSFSSKESYDLCSLCMNLHKRL